VLLRTVGKTWHLRNGAAALAVGLCCLGIAGERSAVGLGAAASGHRCLVVTAASDTSFSRNFNPFTSFLLDFTEGGIYEPLVVVTNAGRGHVYKWLASGLSWSRGGRTLTITVRSGVRWTDGRPLTNRDVLYSLTAGRQAKVMDQIGLTRPGNDVASINLVGSRRVAIHLKRRDSTFVASVLANDFRVVPQHVFAKIKNVGAWPNAHPVGTGPFAVVEQFGTQGYTLGRNPHYWLKGAPHFPCIERVLSSSTESAVLQMVNGDIDLTKNFVPNVEKAYVSYDPRHYHFFYPAVTPPVGLYFDDTKYPYRLVAFRKAISRAINRDEISRFAEYGYAPPVDAIGINRIWNAWMDPRLRAEAKRLASYGPAAARRMLLSAGFTYAKGALLDPRGNRVSIKAKVIATWPDWRAAWQIIRKDLSDIGIAVHVQLVPNWDPWWKDAASTKVATLLWSTAGAVPTPEPYFAEHLDRAAFVPSGKNAELTGNWEHFSSDRGTRLLRAFRRTFDTRVQRTLARKLERLWLQEMPYVPLFAGPEWSTYSTRHFVGFPSKADYYLEPSFSTSDYAVALTRIRPAP
jgi:peptide/nickel transport system substrate-binding protein